jgi:hypothetical protein
MALGTHWDKLQRIYSRNRQRQHKLLANCELTIKIPSLAPNIDNPLRALEGEEQTYTFWALLGHRPESLNSQEIPGTTVNSKFLRLVLPVSELENYLLTPEEFKSLLQTPDVVIDADGEKANLYQVLYVALDNSLVLDLERLAG